MYMYLSHHFHLIVKRDAPRLRPALVRISSGHNVNGTCT